MQCPECGSQAVQEEYDSFNPSAGWRHIVRGRCTKPRKQGASKVKGCGYTWDIGEPVPLNREKSA